MDREQMITSLGLVATHGLYLTDDGSNGPYIDWSAVDSAGLRAIEVYDGYASTQLLLTREQLVQLHAALTATLLADEGRPATG